MRTIGITILTLILLIATTTALAGAISLGDVANNLQEPLNITRHLFFSGSYVLGAGFLVSAIFRYLRFRQNPQEAPFSSVIVLLIAGCLLIIIPLTYQYTHQLARDDGAGNVYQNDE